VKEQVRHLLNYRTAFGDLIIVIVGVLIALAVDSWWEERENRLEEAAHVAALKAEAEQNLVELYATVADIERYTASTRALIEIVEGSREVPPSETLVELTWESFSYGAFDPQFTAYDNLLGTGGTRLLSDEKLKRDLARFRASVDGLTRLDWVLDQWNRQIQPWVVMNLELDWLPETYRNERQLPDPAVPTNWAAVLNDREFKGIVINRLIAFDDYMLGLSRIVPVAEALADRLGVNVEEIRDKGI